MTEGSVRPGSEGDPELLYEPTRSRAEGARVRDFMSWLESSRGLRMETWDELRQWSIADLEGFWGSVWDYFQVTSHAPFARVLGDRRMPGAEWFPGATLNYAEHCFGLPEDAGRTAVVAHSQTRDRSELTYGELTEQVRRARSGLRRLGVGSGDRVAAYLPNIPETLVAFLATASLGAIWASCAPEFGSHSVVDRFAQIEPKVLLVVAGYTYGNRPIDRRGEVSEIRAALPTVEHVVQVPYGDLGVEGATRWGSLLGDTDEELSFAHVPFDHPLYVLFSSGTTGQPKAIVHSHGGILLEHLKNHAFHWDLGPGDRLLWFTTTAWMMWNTLVSSLLVRASMVMIDGNPLHPDLREQWRLAERTGATLMGASPGFLMACRKEGLRPAAEFDLSKLRQLGAAGSPLPAEGYRWVHEQLGDRVLLNVGSGGTDVCTGFVQGSPLQPVWAGEMSGASLGVDAKAFDEQGNVVVGELGELVVTAPMPSMPVGFWDDPDRIRYHAAYFEKYPGVWCHGDWIRFTEVGSCLITGRSDATLNRGGVRLGTAEFYRVLEDVVEVADSVVVHLEDSDGGMGELIVFVVIRDGRHLDDALRARLRAELRTALSPRHVPDTILEVPAVPYNRVGKKLEVPVKRLMRGDGLDLVAIRGSMSNPSSLDAFLAFARSGRSAV